MCTPHQGEGWGVGVWGGGAQFEDPERQAKARQVVPIDEVEEGAAVALYKVRSYPLGSDSHTV